MTSLFTEAAIAETLERIRAVVGQKGVIEDDTEMAPYLTDERDRYHGRAAMVVRPASTEEVAEVVRICSEARIAVVPQGGNTGLCGGATPFEHGGEIVLSLARMNRVREVDRLNYTITVEAGVILAEVQKAAAEAGLFFPLSLGAEGTARIGGNLSTNAGGTGVLRYGNARELALGLEVVLPDGRVLDLLSGLRKDNTGYDLKQLFIGAEGTLGIVTAAVLKLFPAPVDLATAWVAVESPRAAIELLARARAASDDRVCTFEWMPRIAVEFVLRHIAGTRDPLAEPHPHYVLLELSSGRAGADMRAVLESVLAEGYEHGLVRDAAFAESGAQAAEFWKLRETIPEAQKYEGVSIKHDVAVPVSRVADFVAEATASVEALAPGVRPCPFGHLGDGNVHFNLSQPEGGDGAAFREQEEALNRAVHDIVVAMNGSISAEHGIGRLKRGELAHYKSPVALDLMRRIKEAIDPNGILNPGKLL